MGSPLLDDERVAVCIMTDGQENSSKEYTKEAIKALIQGRQKDKNWMISYLAANVDAFDEGVHQRGTMAHASMNFMADSANLAMRAASRSHSHYGLTGDAGPSGAAGFTEEERKKAMGAKP